jgi:NhaP-type Na+/H+ or K+/H+ antiporter
MNLQAKRLSALLLAAPVAAYAQPGGPHVVDALYTFGGGAAGGFLGALLACWLCKRFASKNDNDTKRR